MSRIKRIQRLFCFNVTLTTRNNDAPTTLLHPVFNNTERLIIFDYVPTLATFFEIYESRRQLHGSQTRARVGIIIIKICTNLISRKFCENAHERQWRPLNNFRRVAAQQLQAELVNNTAQEAKIYQGPFHEKRKRHNTPTAPVGMGLVAVINSNCMMGASEIKIFSEPTCSSSPIQTDSSKLGTVTNMHPDLHIFRRMFCHVLEMANCTIRLLQVR